MVVLRARRDESIVTRARAEVYRLAEKYRDRRWYVYGNSEMREPGSFYMTQYFNRIVPRTEDAHLPGALYLVNPAQYPAFEGRLADTLFTDYREIRLRVYLSE